MVHHSEVIFGVGQHDGAVILDEIKRTDQLSYPLDHTAPAAYRSSIDGSGQMQ